MKSQITTRKVGGGRIVAAILLLLLAVPALRSQVNDAGQPSSLAEEQDYSFAYGLFKDGLFQLAAEQFDKFLGRYPASIKRVDAYFLSIESRFQQQHFDSAARLFARFVQDYPTGRLSDDAYLRLGESYFRIRKNKEAISAFKTVLDRFGESELAGEAAYWTGEVFVRTAEYENALKYYLLAYEHFPNNRLRDYALYALGWTYQTKGEYSKAVEWYERLPKEFPASQLVSASFVRRGECYFYMKEYQRAIQELSSLQSDITEVHERGEAAYLVGEAWYNLGEYEKARLQYENFLTTYPDHTLEGETRYSLGWTYLKLNRYLQAEQVFDRLASGTDELAHAGLFRRGIAEKFGGKNAEALATWKDVVERNGGGDFSDNALYESGVLLYEENKIEEAQGYFKRVIQEYPESDVLPESYRMLGECLVSKSDFVPAKEAFARAISLPDASFEVKVNGIYQLGWSQFKLGEFKEAEGTFSEFMGTYENHPKAVDARYWRAEAAYQLGRYAEAAKHYAFVVSKNSSRHEEALYGAGWSHYKLQAFADAAGNFEKLLSRYPNSKFVFDARLRLADCAYFLKEHGKAEGSYRAVIRLFPSHESIDYAFYQLGQTYYRQEKYNDAVKQFSDLMKEFPNSPLADDAQYAIGWIWFQKKEYGEATKEFRKLIESFPSSDLVARAQYSIGDAYYNRQQYADAERAYREILSRFAESEYVADAISGIQYCLLAQGKQKEALDVIDVFVKEHPNSSAAEALFLKKGDLLFSQKQYSEAIKEYGKFVQKFPDSPLTATAEYWIGKCYLAQSRLLEAVQAFERSAAVQGASAKIVVQALLEAGESYLTLKSYEKALGAFSKILEGFSQSEVAPEAAYSRGRVLEESGKVVEAHQQYNSLIASFPRSRSADQARIALARIYLKETNYAEAQGLAEQVSSSRTDEIGAEAQYIAGLNFAAQQQWQEAVTAFLRVRYIFPAHEKWLAKSYLELGKAYGEMKDLVRAREAYRTASKFERYPEVVAEAQRRLKALERS